MYYVLSFRARRIGGAVTSGRLIQGRIDDLRLEGKITFLVHGFNVTRRKGINSLRRLADRLHFASSSAIVSVLWPGDSWLWAVSYPVEGKTADDTADRLSSYLKDIVQLRPDAEISVVSHSLGARVAMRAVDSLLGMGYPVRQICLMAAAIDSDSLAHRDEYRRAASGVDRVGVLASDRDRILRWTYPAGDLLQSFIFLRDRPSSALGLRGPRDHRLDKIPATVYHEQIDSARRAGHGDYVPGKPPNKNQRSAATFADQILRKDRDPHYI